MDARRSTKARWRAVLNRDGRADGEFVYSVKTTGVYCRPSCTSRRARREHVRFHDTVTDAERAGFRACLRCRPAAAEPHPEHAAAVARACALIAESSDVPNLDTLARSVEMSPSHFHRVFKSRTGMTPKAYATAQRSQRVRQSLARSRDVTSAIYAAGFNSSGRFYEKSAEVLGMTPSAFRKGGAGMTIRFAAGKCALGSILVAASERGICSIALGNDREALIRELQRHFTKATLVGGDRRFERTVARVVALVERPARGLDLPLDVRGTVFQHRVWQALREIPCGQTRTYADIAEKIGDVKAIRAVAGACAANAIAVAIPCHRVVRRDGGLSGYRWGVERKAELLGREQLGMKRGQR